MDAARLPPPDMGLATPKEGRAPGFIAPGPFFRPNALIRYPPTHAIQIDRVAASRITAIGTRHVGVNILETLFFP